MQRLYFEGNINSYTYADDGASLYDVLNLYNGQHDCIRDKLIASMSSMEDLEEYIEKTEDPQLGMLVEVVKEYAADIPRLMAELKRKHVSDEEKASAEMIFSTVHRAKGMEYDAVYLVDDFLSEARLEKLKEDKDELRRMSSKWNEEINLLYVAVSRAKAKLYLPENLLPKGFVAGSSVVVVKKKPVEENTQPPFVKPSFREQLLTTKNAGEFWTGERDDVLRRQFHEGRRLASMAAYFRCKPAGIVQRLKQLGCVAGD